MWFKRFWKHSSEPGPTDSSSFEDVLDKSGVKLQYEVGSVSVDTSDTSEASSEKFPDSHDDESQRAGNHVFNDPKIAEYWRNEYEKVKYESRHLFDPDFTWTKEEERKVIWKTDLRALFLATVMFVFLDIDRFNLKNAVADNLLDDLHLTQSDYNLGNTVNLVAFLGAELPSQLISKAVGADRFLPTQVVLWGIAATCQCKMKDRGSFLALRVLVGFLEGGFLPEMITWLTYFYKHSEFTTRSAWFYVANPLTQAFSGLLAAAIINLRGRGGWAGWQYVFLIEGLCTVLMGLIAYTMPAGPANTKAWYRPNGWYTDREEKIVANRILRDDPSKGTLNNRTGVNFKMLFKAFTDYDMILMYFCRMLLDMITSPLGNYSTLILRGMHYSSVHTNLLTVPYCIFGCITMLAESYFSRHTQQYALALAWTGFWPLIPIACMRWWKGFLHDTWGSYMLLFAALSSPSSCPVTISWNSANSYSVARRTVGAAIMNMFSQASGIIASQIFQPDDRAKGYPKGLDTCFSLSIASLAFLLIQRSWLAYRNHSREKKWSRMSLEEQVEYTRTTTIEGNKRLDFRFKL